MRVFLSFQSALSWAIRQTREKGKDGGHGHSMKEMAERLNEAIFTICTPRAVVMNPKLFADDASAKKIHHTMVSAVTKAEAEGRVLWLLQKLHIPEAVKETAQESLVNINKLLEHNGLKGLDTGLKSTVVFNSDALSKAIKRSNPAVKVFT